ncbi:c-type cytochrome [Candidatus Rariloculus sp.]|uniref:c-type cytochrome n=1 Tax=Candidatus Rariloculus sp. TaxID=3101265 RepID=UPI003D0E2556
MFIHRYSQLGRLLAGCLLAMVLAACSQDSEMPDSSGEAGGEAAAPDSEGAAGDEAAAEEAEPEAYVFDRPFVPPSPPANDLVARGEYLVESIVGCGNCHSGRDENGEFVEGQEYAGNFVIAEPVFTANAPNITPDPETGIGDWTDEEIERAIREGIASDGRVMGPPMAFAYYRDISSNDMAAMIAYLRAVPAVNRVVPESEFNMPLPPAWGEPVTEPVPDIPRSDRLAYGRYLSHALGHCTQCHTPLAEESVGDFSRIGSGMNLYPLPFGYDWSALAANITQHETLGLGAWTDDEIKRAIVYGISRDGRELLPFMGFDFYERISDEDLDLIVEYVKSLPPSEAEPPAAEEE